MSESDLVARTRQLLPLMHPASRTNGFPEFKADCSSCCALVEGVSAIPALTAEVERLRAVLESYKQPPTDEYLAKLYERYQRNIKSRTWRIVGGLIHSLRASQARADAAEARLAELKVERDHFMWGSHLWRERVVGPWGGWIDTGPGQSYYDPAIPLVAASVVSETGEAQ